MSEINGCLPNHSLQPTADRAAFQVALRLCRIFGQGTLAVSRVRPAIVLAFQAHFACEVVSCVTSAA